MINWKAKLKLIWTKYYVLSAAANENQSDNDNNNKANEIIFTIKDTTLYVPVVTLSAKNNQQLLKLLSKGFERSVYWNEHKTKRENKITVNEFGYFLESSFVGVDRLFILVDPNRNNDIKRFNARKYCLAKNIIIIDQRYAIISGKSFYNQPIDSDIKRYKEIRKLETGQSEDYTTGCLLDYDYIKHHYRLITVDLSRQKELDVDPKATQQIELDGQLKNVDGINTNGAESMFVLTILEKVKETRLECSQGSVTVLQKC